MCRSQNNSPSFRVIPIKTKLIKKLTDKGKKAVETLARQNNLTEETVTAMLQAVVNGGGTMAQFNIPELGGPGQWMKGGMTMVSDMFNHSLKGKVDQLCNELSLLVTSEDLFHPVDVEKDNQYRTASNWWPPELGTPASSGAQNNLRYAFFPATQRLAVEEGGVLTIYDTLDHHISGVSQQQGSGHSVIFTSQHGRIDLAKLPVVAGTANSSGSSTGKEARPAAALTVQDHPDRSAEIIKTIEQLAGLLKKGVLSQEEFDRKKAELLDRL